MDEVWKERVVDVSARVQDRAAIEEPATRGFKEWRIILAAGVQVLLTHV